MQMWEEIIQRKEKLQGILWRPVGTFMQLGVKVKQNI